MHKIYTCKYFVSWSKHTHVSKSISNLRSHANSVHVSILKGTRTCLQTVDNSCHVICALVLHLDCLMKNYWDERAIS